MQPAGRASSPSRHRRKRRRRRATRSSSPRRSTPRARLLGQHDRPRAREARAFPSRIASSSGRPRSCARRSFPARSTSIRNIPATAPSSSAWRTTPLWKAARTAYRDVANASTPRSNKLVWLERAPANNTWLIAVRGDLARREKLATMEDFAKLLASRRRHQARRLGRVRRKRRGAAVLRARLRFQDAPRSDHRPARRRHRRHHARRGPERERRQRRHGLRHRRGDRGPRPRRHGRTPRARRSSTSRRPSSVPTCCSAIRQSRRPWRGSSARSR